MLVQALSELGGRVSWHIPVRAQEGHGISPAVLEQRLAAPDPPRLMITCDTGATAFEALELARRRELKVIVTDHHELERDAGGRLRLPPAEAFVTPRLLPGADALRGEAALRHHPLASLPGVGVAFKLVEALYESEGRIEAADQYLDLVALGIVGRCGHADRRDPLPAAARAAPPAHHAAPRPAGHL
jgi:single-stranded-DNA-specific exonuclease